MPVYAGMAPLGVPIFSFTSADLSHFLAAFGAGLLSNSIYAYPFSMEGCVDGCRSFILPGTLATARVVAPHLNMSLYSTDAFDRSNTIRIHNTTGIVVRYDRLAPSSLDFDISTECVYTGQDVLDGLQLCFRQEESSVVAGWSGCPRSVSDESNCDNGDPPPWPSERIVSGTRMSVFRLRTMASYNRITQDILDVTPLSPPQPVSIMASDYYDLFRTALVPSPDSSPEDLVHIRSLIFALAWMHRTYQKTFPDDYKSPVAFLQNLMAVPLQFGGVSAAISANYSASLPECSKLADSYRRPLPDTVIANAVGVGFISYEALLTLFLGVLSLPAAAFSIWMFSKNRWKTGGYAAQYDLVTRNRPMCSVFDIVQGNG